MIMVARSSALQRGGSAGARTASRRLTTDSSSGSWKLQCSALNSGAARRCRPRGRGDGALPSHPRRFCCNNRTIDYRDEDEHPARPAFGKQSQGELPACTASNTGRALPSSHRRHHTGVNCMLSGSHLEHHGDQALGRAVGVARLQRRDSVPARRDLWRSAHSTSGPDTRML